MWPGRRLKWPLARRGGGCSGRQACCAERLELARHPRGAGLLRRPLAPDLVGLARGRTRACPEGDELFRRERRAKPQDVAVLHAQVFAGPAGIVPFPMAAKFAAGVRQPSQQRLDFAGVRPRAGRKHKQQPAKDRHGARGPRVVAMPGGRSLHISPSGTRRPSRELLTRCHRDVPGSTSCTCGGEARRSTHSTPGPSSFKRRW